MEGSMPTTGHPFRLDAATEKQKQLLEQALRDDDGGYITGPMLCRRYGVSEQSIWRWRRDPALGFPKVALHINGRNYWKLGDLIKWERRRARRDAA
jgi:hypothetical protein